jgi:hypothetical protein
MAAAKIQAQRSDGRAGASAAAGRPQRWQNRARGDSAVPQPSQARAARLAPQLLQKRPEAGLPHAGHVTGVDAVIGAGR